MLQCKDLLQISERQNSDRVNSGPLADAQGPNFYPDRELAREHRSLEEIRVDQMVKDAENARACIFDVPGKHDRFDLNNNFAHSAMVDETYLSVASHVEESIVKKIIDWEYVDFNRLIPRDKVFLEQDNRIEIVNKDGHPYFVPVRDNLTTISLFSRWEQAFRVF